MPDRDQPATMTVEQAAKLIGISRRSAYRAAADGHLPTLRLGRRILVPTARLHRMLGLTADGEAPDSGTPDRDGPPGQAGNGGPSSPANPGQEPSR